MPNVYRREFWQLSFGENALNSAGPRLRSRQPLVYPLWQAPDSGLPSGFGTVCVPLGIALEILSVFVSGRSNAQSNLIHGGKLQDDNLLRYPFAMAVFLGRNADFRVVAQGFSGAL